MSRYDKLFDEYFEELIDARKEVSTWWNSLFDAEIENSGDYKRAESIIRPRWPCGPASHPRIIAIYRKYFLLCEELNSTVTSKWEAEEELNHNTDDGEDLWGADDIDENEEDGIVEPRFILIERLEAEDKDLGEYINALVFSPIGINEQGELV